MTLSAKRLGTVVTPPANATTVIYTVPAGRRAMVRDVRVDIGGGIGTQFRMAVDPAGVGNAVDIIRDDLTGQQHTESLVDAFIVLDQGDSIICILPAAANADVWLSGHEFVL